MAHNKFSICNKPEAFQKNFYIYHFRSAESATPSPIMKKAFQLHSSLNIHSPGPLCHTEYQCNDWIRVETSI